MNLNYICAGAANLHWIIINPNSYPINYTWSGDIYSGNGTADQGLNQLTTPVGSGPYSVTITYPGGSDTDSPTSATCPSWP
jgi:hypothetical protein